MADFKTLDVWSAAKGIMDAAHEASASAYAAYWITPTFPSEEGDPRPHLRSAVHKAIKVIRARLEELENAAGEPE